VVRVGQGLPPLIGTAHRHLIHLSYALEVDGRAMAAFTGGSLLYGSTGRSDLLGAQHAETLARHQHASAYRLVAELPADTQVYPTHGFGSFCEATQAQGLSSTLANEARVNRALTQAEEDYVTALLAGLDAYPAYYAQMGPANAAGPAPIDLSPPHVADPAELRRRIDAGGVGGRPAQPHRVRRRAPAGHAQLRAP
jgi:hypothetical protein